MAITSADVKRLRETTGVGMMDCKRALEEADGDFEQAIEILRKKGQKVAAKRAEREAKEGLIVTAVSDDRRRGVIAEVNCETDFVARNEDFANFAQQIAGLLLQKAPKDMDALNVLPFGEGRTVGEAVTDMTGKIGEKIDVRRFTVMDSKGGSVVSYIHPGSRLGVLVDVKANGDAASVGRDLAMQVAALSPVATRRDEVPQEVKDKEMEIAREAARNEGKPDQILDRIAQGKLERYYKDFVLVEQPFVKDASISVQDMLKEADADVVTFVRYALGD
ncbi:MAG TPA: translation elongation factor Ts [Rhodothermales bacterium]|nr:translation elongation factor Ts [Rhodothermales bacterium]